MAVKDLWQIFWAERTPPKSVPLTVTALVKLINGGIYDNTACYYYPRGDALEDNPISIFSFR